jgi:hypothetical protein
MSPTRQLLGSVQASGSAAGVPLERAVCRAVDEVYYCLLDRAALGKAHASRLQALKASATRVLQVCWGVMTDDHDDDDDDDAEKMMMMMTTTMIMMMIMMVIVPMAGRRCVTIQCSVPIQ